MSTTVVSCPGKVLLAGGYLVLDQAYSGLVAGTSSRFYSAVQSRKLPPGGQRAVTVRSPQFRAAAWKYDITDGEEAVIVQEAEGSTSSNKFVQLAFSAAFNVAFAQGHRLSDDEELDVVIVGDNDFYSQKSSSGEDDPMEASSSQEPEPFAFLDCKLSEVHKTGLGSSAAMVTSLIAAILLHLSLPSSSETVDELTLQIIHNTAQYAHSQAQGKVGSGFDVSSAIWGSQVYTRFNPSCLDSLLSSSSTLSATSLLAALSPSASKSPWRSGSSTASKVQPFSLPPHTSLLLADVDAGSNTPSMVSKVLAWRKAHPKEAQELWSTIDEENQNLAKTFALLQESYAEDPEKYRAIVRDFKHKKADDWRSLSFLIGHPPPEAIFVELRNAITDIRTSMKKLGDLCSVPIEPDSQTSLLDACVSECMGVIGGGVPGAGGYDAIWVLVLDDEESGPTEGQSPEQQVKHLWKSWKDMRVSSLSPKAKIKGAEGVFGHDSARQSGLRRHRLEEVDGLARFFSS